jgi:adenine-specific DNA-methyltransferase
MTTSPLHEPTEALPFLRMHTRDGMEDNVAHIQALFPHCVTEIQQADGSLKLAIDFDALRQELSDQLVEGPQERYHLNWPGKRQALLTANAPIAKTLRPCRDQSVNFDTTQNVFIEGDNLDALKLLQETYLGQVKMIYIDPPYNTGKDFIYSDNFATSTADYLARSLQKDEAGQRLNTNLESNGRFHSDWLSMMYPRLKLARHLLREDGVIFISIDDNEAANLKLLCDEIFGAENFVGQFIWNKQHSQQQGLFKKYHEYILLYAKNINSHTNISGGMGLIDAGAMKKISKANPASDFEFPAGVRFDAQDDFTLTGTYGDSEQVTVIKGILKAKSGKTEFPVTLNAGWTQKLQMASYFNGEDVFDTKGQKVIEFYFSSTGKVKCIKDRSKITPPTILPEYGMVSEQTKALSNLLGANVFDNPKPIKMIMDFIGWFTDNNDLILDFFAGSGTTAHAVMQLNAEDGGNRRSISVQIPELNYTVDEKTGEETPKEKTAGEAYKAGYKTIADITRARITKAAAKIKAEHPEATVDTGFRMLKIDTSNLNDVYYAPDALERSNLALFVDNLKSDRSAEDLLFQVLLEYGVDLSLPITTETIEGLPVHCVDDSALLACFDDQGGITDALVKRLAAKKPLRVVFRDAGFKDSATKINVAQIFKQLSPSTDIKCL